jgi:hypothetical protein
VVRKHAGEKEDNDKGYSPKRRLSADLDREEGEEGELRADVSEVHGRGAQRRRREATMRCVFFFFFFPLDASR